MAFSTSFFHFYPTAPQFVHLRVPAARASALLATPSGRRVWCQIDEAPAFQAALMPTGDGDYYININKALRERYGWRVGRAVRVDLRPDDSEYGMPVPEAFTALCAEDPVGEALFNALTPGKQRALLHQIAKPKRPATRVRRAVGIFDYLHHSGGRLDFEELRDFLKR